MNEAEPLDTYAEAERFVNSLLPDGVVLKVLDIKAATQQFEIRDPVYVVGVDVVQAERGVRHDADEHRVMDLERVDLEREEYDVVLCINVLPLARSIRFACVRRRSSRTSARPAGRSISSGLTRGLFSGRRASGFASSVGVGKSSPG